MKKIRIEIEGSGKLPRNPVAAGLARRRFAARRIDRRRPGIRGGKFPLAIDA